MSNSLTRWVNQLRNSRLKQKEVYDILAECFEEGKVTDEEIAQELGIQAREIQRLREKYDS